MRATAASTSSTWKPMVDAELHGFAFDHAAKAQDRNVETAVGEINAALADPDLLQAECVFVEGGGFFDVMSADRDMLDLRHGMLLSPRERRRYFCPSTSFRKRQSMILSSVISSEIFSCSLARRISESMVFLATQPS